MTARNGAATKAARTKGPAVDTKLPRGLTSSQREIAALRKEVAEIKEQSDTTKQLVESLINEIRMAAIKQAMSTPEGQDAIAKLLMEGAVNGQQIPNLQP